MRFPKFFEIHDEWRIFNLHYGFQKLYRLNKVFSIPLPNGKNDVMHTFTTDHEVVKMSSLYRALQERTKEMRDMRDFAVLDAAT